MKNPQAMMKQLQQMQSRMARMEKELGELRVTGSAGGGVVTVVADGHQKLLEVTISPEAVEEGVELLADLVLAACNDALDQSRAQAATHMGQLTAGLGLPPGIL